MTFTRYLLGPQLHHNSQSMCPSYKELPACSRIFSPELLLSWLLASVPCLGVVTRVGLG